jgi:hypothetical protein
VATQEDEADDGWFAGTSRAALVVNGGYEHGMK